MDYYSNHTEVRKIIEISSDKKSLTLNKSLEFRHYSNTEYYDGESFPMKCEVGLLTRNIKI